jgi:hypothetical protein
MEREALLPSMEEKLAAENSSAGMVKLERRVCLGVILYAIELSVCPHIDYVAFVRQELR